MGCLNVVIKKHHSFKIADAIVSLLSGTHELELEIPEAEPGSFLDKYGLDIVLNAWDNCREQGYCFTLDSIRRPDNPYHKPVTVRFGEHRNVDCPVVWVGDDKYEENSFKRHTFKNVDAASEFILEIIENYLLCR